MTRSEMKQKIELWPVRPSERSPADEAQVAMFEDENGLVFPVEYRWFLLNYAGGEIEGEAHVFVPSRRNGLVVKGYPEAFYRSVSLAEIGEQMKRHPVWDLDLVDPGAESPWWTRQIPIHPYMHDTLYCLDFHYNAAAPPVVRIDYGEAHKSLEAGPAHLGWVNYVAPSFAEMVVNQMEILSFDDAPLPMDEDQTPYAWAEEAETWRSSLREYLGRYHQLSD